MKKLLSVVFIIGLIFSFSGQGLSAINKDRFLKDRKGFSSVVGVYHGELTLDFSSGWNNPTTSYRVLKNELGLNVNYRLKSPYGGTQDIQDNSNRKLFIYISNIIFNINNRDFSPVGKSWAIYLVPNSKDPNVSYISLGSDYGKCRGNSFGTKFTIFFTGDKNLESYETNLKVKIPVIITDCLWKDSEDENIDNRDNDNRRDNPNDEGRDHRRRRYPLRIKR